MPHKSALLDGADMFIRMKGGLLPLMSSAKDNYCSKLGLSRGIEKGPKTEVAALILASQYTRTFGHWNLLNVAEGDYKFPNGFHKSGRDGGI